ncbi:MAG: Ig-like domain-containing protein, partial [Chloroflexota bacterium]
MKFSKFDYIVWGAVVVVGLAIAGVLVVGDQVGARAARTIPNDGGEVGGGERIGIEFAQPMQADSVEARFSVEPSVSGKFVWEGQTLWFAPSQLFEHGTRYTARLSAGALAEDGQALKRDIAWSFTVRAPWIVYAGPATGQHQLWRVSSEGGEAAQLTSGGQPVFDFAVAPDGTQVAYSLPNDQNGI